MRIIRRLRFALVIPALALLPLASCFDTTKPSELSCTQSKYCPDGYVCVGAQTGSPGKCQKPADAGGFDVPIVVDSADSIDGRANTDGPVPPNDGPTTNTDMPAAIDQAPSLDTSNEPDTASDLPASADLDRDVPSDAPISPPDTSADNTVPVPDLGPDQKPEGPDVGPDLMSGSEVGPDTPSTSCVIGGTSYANGAANPANACQTCQTAYALTSWTVSAHGASCGTGQVCSGGTCQSGCWIEGALVGSGTTNSSNVCQICKPATSTSGWSNNIDGTSCGSGQICSAGTCQPGCYVGGAIYAMGALNPSNGCQSCNPAISTSAWYQVPSDCATIAAHGNFTCATVSGVAKCWGTNGDGILGQSDVQLPSSAVPVTISALGTNVQAISTGGGSAQSCALVGGGVRCWGRNDYGQLGNGSTVNSYTPIQVTGIGAGGMGIATGETHTCALQNGQVECWGTNTNGQLGSASSQGVSLPVAISLSTNAQAITSGAEHSCALVSGSVWCWGYNSSGQLGNNSTTDSSVPVQVSVSR